MGRTVQKISCAEETMANRRGLDMHWRGRRQCGGAANDTTQALRVIQARLEAIETTQRRGVVVESHDESDEEMEAK